MITLAVLNSFAGDEPSALAGAFSLSSSHVGVLIIVFHEKKCFNHALPAFLLFGGMS